MIRGRNVKQLSDDCLILALFWFLIHAILFRLFVDFPSIYKAIIPFSNKTMGYSFWFGLLILFLSRVLYYLHVKILRTKL